MRILHQRSTCALLALALAAFICSTAWRGASNTSQAQAELLGIESRLPALDPYAQACSSPTPTDGTKSPSCPQRVWITTLHFPLTVGGSFSHRSVLVRWIFTGFTRMAVGWSG